MFARDLTLLDPDATLSAAREAQAIADWGELRLLQAAAHWGDLHGAVEEATAGSSLPGMERLVLLGGAGTPAVGEFAPAELGAELAMDRRVAPWAHSLSWGRLDAIIAGAVIAADPEAAAKAARQAETQQGVWVGQSTEHRPPATLYVHIGADALTRDGGGVARLEGVGAVTVDQIRHWLGHCTSRSNP